MDDGGLIDLHIFSGNTDQYAWDGWWVGGIGQLEPLNIACTSYILYLISLHVPYIYYVIGDHIKEKDLQNI